MSKTTRRDDGLEDIADLRARLVARIEQAERLISERERFAIENPGDPQVLFDAKLAIATFVNGPDYKTRLDTRAIMAARTVYELAFAAFDAGYGRGHDEGSALERSLVPLAESQRHGAAVAKAKAGDSKFDPSENRKEMLRLFTEIRPTTKGAEQSYALVSKRMRAQGRKNCSAGTVKKVILARSMRDGQAAPQSDREQELDAYLYALRLVDAGETQRARHILTEYPRR